MLKLKVGKYSILTLKTMFGSLLAESIENRHFERSYPSLAPIEWRTKEKNHIFVRMAPAII